MSVRSVYFLTFFAFIPIDAVPPEACFANFRWDDCGKAPEPVMYYWKPGSRCEVGLWRGCLPNINMFKDEYECVSTCIFTARAMPADYHSMNEIYDYNEPATEGTGANDETTSSNDVTTSMTGEGSVTTESGDSTTISGQTSIGNLTTPENTTDVIQTTQPT